ncbi:MAG: D-alanyl-D-alanine carboxypeptidase [bacterium]|jgi:D-alanyl-D-alanine carboxypeptidase/D-alanyl-D-alanine-endopeptidase (penicillin-binding protein 4)
MRLKILFYLKISYFKIKALIFILLYFVNFNLAIADNLIKNKIDSELLSLKSGKIGLVFIDIYDNDKIIYQKNAYDLFIPASSMKLLTTYCALSNLSPFYFFELKLYTDGEIYNSTLNGNLIINSDFNPTLIEEIIYNPYEFLYQVIKETLESYSIKTINGNFYIDYSIHKEKNIPEFPKSWEIYKGEPYAPYVISFSFNQNMIKIIKNEKNITIFPPNLNINPNLIINKSSFVDNAYWYIYDNPFEYNILIFKSIFKDLNLNVKIESLYNKKSNIKLLNTYLTETLLSALRYQNYWSDNYVAQSIYYLLKYKYEIDLQEYYRNLGFYNVIIDDGCGLSRKNRVSPFMFAKLISYSVKNGLNNYISYTLPGYLEGTLSNRKDLPKTIKAKTGTLNDVSALTGFIKTNSNKYLSFAILYNGPYTYDAKILEEKILKIIYDNY